MSIGEIPEQRSLAGQDDRLLIFTWTKFFLSKWKLIGAWIIGVVALGIVISLLLPKGYEARATMLPSKSGSAREDVSRALAMFMGGGSSQDQFSEQLYPFIIQSQTIKDSLLTSELEGKPLTTWLRFGDELPDEVPPITALEYRDLSARLSKLIEIKIDLKTDFVEIRCMTGNPELSAFIVNQLIREMDEYFRYRMVTNSREQLKQIETRLAQVNDSLAIAEEALTAFQQENRAISQSPLLVLEQQRLQRQVTIRNRVFVELSTQREMAQVDVLNDVPILTVLDWATPPLKKDKPERRKIVVGFFVLGFALSLLHILAARYRRWILESWRKA